MAKKREFNFTVTMKDGTIHALEGSDALDLYDRFDLYVKGRETSRGIWVKKGKERYLILFENVVSAVRGEITSTEAKDPAACQDMELCV